MSRFEYVKCLKCGGDLIRVPGHPDLHPDPACAGEGSWHSPKDLAWMNELFDANRAMATAAIVVAFGGRDYNDEVQVERFLRDLNPHATLREGGASGADRLCAKVWRAMGGTVEEYEADWSGPCTLQCPRGHRRAWPKGGDYCPAAGPRRNRLMVRPKDKPKAELGLQFPGGRGTADMAATLRAAGVLVRVVPHREVAPKRALPTRPKPGRRAA